MHTLILFFLIFAHCITYGSVEKEHSSFDPPLCCYHSIMHHVADNDNFSVKNILSLQTHRVGEGVPMFSPGPGLASEFRRPP